MKKLLIFCFSFLLLFSSGLSAFHAVAGTEPASGTPEERLQYYQELVAKESSPVLRVTFSPTFPYGDFFESIRAMASVVYPGKTTEECGRDISVSPGIVLFSRSDLESMPETMVLLEQYPGVVYVRCDPISFADCMYDCGDVDGDGDTDASDYLTVKKAVLGVSALSLWQSYLADANWDCAVDSIDYLLIKQLVLGIRSDDGRPASWSAPFAGNPYKRNR